jgi:hypothetical protein
VAHPFLFTLSLPKGLCAFLFVGARYIVPVPRFCSGRLLRRAPSLVAASSPRHLSFLSSRTRRGICFSFFHSPSIVSLSRGRCRAPLFRGRNFSSDIKAHPNPIVIPNGAGRFFPSRFAPANRSACAERNLSSLCIHLASPDPVGIVPVPRFCSGRLEFYPDSCRGGGLPRLQRRIHPASVVATSPRHLAFSVIPTIAEGSWLDVRIGTVDGIISPLPRVSSRTERGICFSLRL